MTLLEMLRRARASYVAGEHVFAGMLMLPDLLDKSAEGDKALVNAALCLLDECSPGRNFHFFVDGGRWRLGGPVYHYDRKPSEVAAVFGRACMHAAELEEETT